MNVKIVKLVSGEELIGEFDEKTNAITNPVVMIPVSDKSIGFSPWMPYSEDKSFNLKKEGLLSIDVYTIFGDTNFKNIFL